MIEINLAIALIIYLICSFIVVKKNGYGYLPVLFSCYFIFILIVPAFFHVSDNVFPFYGLSYDYDVQYKASIVLLIFSIVFWLGFFWNQKLIHPNKTDLYRVNHIKRVSGTRFYLVFYSSVLITLLLMFSYGPEVFMVKRIDFDREAFGENLSAREFVINFVKTLSFCNLFFIIFLRKNFNRIAFLFNFSLVLIIFFIINFPLALPRFVFFSYILLLFCFFFRSTFKRKLAIFTSVILGITTIFPYFSHLTRGEGGFNIDMGEYYRMSGDFDGFQSVINAIIYVNKNGLEYGNQILSSIFSFIPRSIWTTKAEPTGAIAAASAGYDYVNISSPLPAEFYVDFGFVGLIIFSFLFGILLRRIDIFYIFDRNLGLKYIIAVITISMIPIISRGALLAVLNNFYVMIFTFSIMYFLIFFKIKLR